MCRRAQQSFRFRWLRRLNRMELEYTHDVQISSSAYWHKKKLKCNFNIPFFFFARRKFVRKLLGIGVCTRNKSKRQQCIISGRSLNSNNTSIGTAIVQPTMCPSPQRFFFLSLSYPFVRSLYRYAGEWFRFGEIPSNTFLATNHARRKSQKTENKKISKK